jgi:DNA-binding MarR family transcriptional regulator
VATVARRLGQARQSVQRVGDDLVTDGLVARHDNPDHRTAPLLALTDAGREALTTLVTRGDAARARVLTEAGVTARELLGCRDVLRRLTAALSASS